jgi:phospholipase C
VPAFLVSPHVTPGVPFTGAVDHTSFLQLLADRFDGGKPYSPAVAGRQRLLVPLASALTAPPAITEPPPDVAAPAAGGGVPAAHPQRNTNDTGDAFHEAAMKLAREHPATLANPAWSGLARYVAVPATMPKHS